MNQHWRSKEEPLMLGQVKRVESQKKNVVTLKNLYFEAT